MEIRSIKDILSACIHPHFFRNSLTHWAATVTAGIVMNLYEATILTYTYICTIGTGLAVHDVMCNLCLYREGEY